MRTVQVSVHVKLFNGQLSEEYAAEHGNVFDVHAYADSNNVGEAILCAVADVFNRIEQVTGKEYGSRRDTVSSDEPEEIGRMATRLEPARPIDIRDIKALSENIKRHDDYNE